jgi:hypothetical protein
MDSNLLIELPMQLYLGQLPDSQTEKVSVKVRGQKKELSIEPLRVKTLGDLQSVLDKRFYQFIEKSLTTQSDCNNLSSKNQKLYDSRCKFFQSDALAGLVIALKRIIIINIPESVRDD